MTWTSWTLSYFSVFIQWGLFPKSLSRADPVFPFLFAPCSSKKGAATRRRRKWDLRQSSRRANIGAQCRNHHNHLQYNDNWTSCCLIYRHSIHPKFIIVYVERRCDCPENKYCIWNNQTRFTVGLIHSTCSTIQFQNVILLLVFKLQAASWSFLTKDCAVFINYFNIRFNDGLNLIWS